MEKDQNNVSSEKGTFSFDRVFAFHASIFILGGFLILPNILAGALSRMLDDMSYFRLVIFSCFTLLPVSIAFGKEMKFSLSRFILSAVAIASLSFAQGIRYSKGGPFLVPLAGGGVFGLGIGFITGYLGLKVYDWMRRFFSIKMWIAFGLIVLLSFGLYIYSEIQHGRLIHMPIEKVMSLPTEERRLLSDDILVKGTGNIVDIIIGSPYMIVLDLPELHQEMVLLSRAGKGEYFSFKDAMNALEIGDTVEFRGRYFPAGVVYSHEFQVLAESGKIIKLEN